MSEVFLLLRYVIQLPEFSSYLRLWLSSKLYNVALAAAVVELIQENQLLQTSRAAVVEMLVCELRDETDVFAD